MTELLLGVTGHRYLAEVARLEAGVERALEVIEDRFPGRRLIALSSLAEGADRMVVERLLARPGAALRVVLPLPHEEYEADFSSAASRREFGELLALAEEVVQIPASASRVASYRAAGRVVVDRSDALIAIWDGRPAQGRAGTAILVARARRRGLPLCWIQAGNRRAGTDEPTTLGAQQGGLIIENL